MEIGFTLLANMCQPLDNHNIRNVIIAGGLDICEENVGAQHIAHSDPLFRITDPTNLTITKPISIIIIVQTVDKISNKFARDKVRDQSIHERFIAPDRETKYARLTPGNETRG